MQTKLHKVNLPNFKFRRDSSTVCKKKKKREEMFLFNRERRSNRGLDNECCCCLPVLVDSEKLIEIAYFLY